MTLGGKRTSSATWMPKDWSQTPVLVSASVSFHLLRRRSGFLTIFNFIQQRHFPSRVCPVTHMSYDVEILYYRIFLDQRRELVEVSCKHREAAYLLNDVFTDGPREPEAIISARSSTQFID